MDKKCTQILSPGYYHHLDSPGTCTHSHTKYHQHAYNFYTKLAKSSFLCRFRVESVNVFCSSTIRFEHVFFINKQFNKFAHAASAFPNEFTVRWYEYCTGQHWNFTGYKKIKQRRISFVLGYLRMILWKISTAISIKHRILATFNKTKSSILTAYMLLTVNQLEYSFQSV